MGYTVRSPPGLSIRNSYPDLEAPPSQDPMDMEYTIPRDRLDYPNERIASREAAMVAIIPGLGPGPGQGLGPNIDDRHSKRYRGGRSEFEGDVQYLDQRVINQAEERDLNYEPTHLNHREQNDILSQVNRRLSQCAFDFIAMYQFPIPLEPGKPKVCVATDKAWTEWVFLLKRLATKRRIPSKAIYDGQIKHLTTILDNSMETRHATKPQPRPLKDDRNVLQQISAGIQVGKMLKDAATMKFLDTLYLQTEMVIQDRINNGSTSR